MYFPFLNNKQSENLCLRALSEEGQLTKVIPIINTFFSDENTDWSDSESVNKFFDKKFKSLIQTFYDKKNKFILVINNTLFDNNITIEQFYNRLVSYTDVDLKDFFIFGIYDSNFSLTTDIFFNDKQYAILYENANFQSNQNICYNILLNEGLLLEFLSQNIDNKVIITDAFIKKTTNRGYASDDPFINHIFTYQINGFIGFGDYTILPKNNLSSDGANMNNITVATHLTYKNNINNNLYIHHNICTPESEPHNVRRIQKVIEQIKAISHKFYQSNGLKKLVLLNSTSLGKLKELTISHHIEKINSLI